MIRLPVRFVLFLILCFCFAGMANAQSYTDEFLTYRFTAHYPEHTIVAYVKPVDKVTISNDKKYYWFSGNQVNITQGGYTGKLLNGDYQDLYLNKNLKETGRFDKGLKVGAWKNWSQNGILKDEFYFKNGIRNGAYSKYDSVGRVIEQGSYRNDLLNGKQKTFRLDSTIIVKYKDGKIKQRKSIIPKFIYKVLPKKFRKKA